MAYLTREGDLQEEFLTGLIVSGFLNHKIFFDINFLFFSPSLLLLLSAMASCVETFEAEVIHLCLFTFTDKLVVFQLIWKILRLEIVNYEAFPFIMRLCS